MPADESNTPPDRLIALLSDPEAAVKLLPQEEQDAYRRCQESIVEARRSAQKIEGRIVIGGSRA